LSYFSQTKTGGREKSRVNGSGVEAGPVEAASATEQNLNDTVSTLGAGTLITGNIVCEGCAQILGRVIGDIQAVKIVLSDGARVEGNITAQEVDIYGAFKGTIRAHFVRLKGTATIDGEVFSKSLTVEENVQFEGLSRRLEKPIELPSSFQANGEKPAATTLAESASIAAASA
jgi:cytoskeletal protein CcmA (bactofilin family)